MISFSYIKYFCLLSLFFVCCTQQQTEKHTTNATNIKKEILKPTARHFNNQQPFKIVSVINSIANSTYTDTSKCSEWQLSNQAIDSVIRHAEPIGGTTWDLSFAVLSCEKTILVEQYKQQFTIRLNAGSFFSVSDTDTSLLFGNYNKADEKYFLASPDNE